MNNLLKLISRGENEGLEFKESLRLKEEIGQAVSAFSNAYKRVGKTNQRTSPSELRNLAKESGEKVYWDERICEEANLENIDEEKVKLYLEKRQEIRGVKKPEKMDLNMIFDDRIEIVNPGSFPEGVTPEKPRHIPVNPVLCQLMYDVGFIEKYVSSKTASLELRTLVRKDLLDVEGRGRSTKYVPKI